MFSDSYDYPEVFGEKVRALGERGRPRDLYDVINLFRNDHLPASAVIQDILSQKCSYKDIRVPTLIDMDAYRDDMSRNWEPMLSHQLPTLPELDVYWDSLPAFFSWLEGHEMLEKPQLSAISGEGQLYQPVYGHLGLRTLSGRSLEIIRFAAGNRLCVNLDYTDNTGRRSSRVIEPYSLRQAQNGNVFLYAVRADDGQIRAYKIAQINDSSITNRVFTPRYQVELSPSGVSVPVTQSTPLISLGLPERSRSTSFMRGQICLLIMFAAF